MGRPPPCVLFAQSFLHPRLSEYVDEVRFTEPVVISACEILELHTSSLCPTLSLSGVSSPQSFALEVFIRSGGEARFKRLCPAFLYSPSASNLLEVQAAVTDHLVIRGSYRALSLVVYGNPAKDLGQFNVDHDIESTLSDLIVPSESACKPEDLPEALQLVKGKQCRQLLPLQYLRLACGDPEQSLTIHRLLSLVAGIVESFSDSDIVHKMFSILLSATSALMSEDRVDNAFSQWPSFTAVSGQQKQRKVKLLLEKARGQIEEVYEQLQYKSINSIEQPLTMVNESSVVEVICHWLQTCLQSLAKTGKSTSLVNASVSIASTEESLMGCLAAVQLLCMDAQWCFRFVVTGGIRLLVDILQFSSTEASAAVLLLLEAMKFASRHAFACEALLGWSPLPASASTAGEESSPITGYAVILRLLLQTKRYHVAQMAALVLHHLRVYELAASFQSLAEPLLDNSSLVIADLKLQPGLNHALKKASTILKQFLEVLTAKDLSHNQSPAQTAQWLILDGDDSASALALNATYSLIASSNYCAAIQDLNPCVLVALQERRLLPLLAAILSASWMRSSVGHTKDLFLEFLGTVEALLLSLVSCRSGLLFLASDLEAASAIVSALGGVQEVTENELVNYRHAFALTSLGFLCHPQDVAAVLETSLSVISSIDRLLVTTKWSEDWLWALWELTVFSRTEAGRQALSGITFFPEGFALIMEALQPESESTLVDMMESRGLKRAIIHSAAELMHIILTDQSACTLAAWLPHALSLQKGLHSCSPTNIDLAVGSYGVGAGSKDTLCARLLDWVDAAVVYHKKGAVGVLRYAAAVVVGSANQLAAAGLPVSDSVEPDGNAGEATGSTELPTVETLLGRGVTLGGSGTILSDTAVIQLTVSMRILSSISCHQGVAAVLYGEGAMSILYLLLEYGAGFFQTSTSDYDYVVEEDGDGDGTTEMLIEQGRERLLLGLLLPTLLLLLSLLRRLQVTGEEYRNTRLVEMLLYLHRGISARLVSRTTVPAEAGGMLVLAAVSRVLISVLACWPVFGWTPSLFAKLLGVDAKTTVAYAVPLPLEPKESSSVLRILGDMLPEEHPQLCTDRAAAMNIFRSMAVQTLLGTKSMDMVGWHCQVPASEKLLQLLVPHLDQISTMVFHLTCTTCAVLQELLKILLIRFACQSKDYACILVRPLLSCVREHNACGPSTSDMDAFRVERYLQFFAELVKHPATKRALLQEGIISVLLQALNTCCPPKGDGSPVGDGSVPFGWAPHILNSFASICDPYISLVPAASLNRRLVEDCPSFGDLCSIVIALSNFFKYTAIGEDMEIAAEVMGRIASHKLGRAAFASYALSIHSSVATPLSLQRNMADVPGGNANSETKETSSEFYEVKDATPLFATWKRLVVALEAERGTNGDIGRLIERFAFASIQLSGAGRSACGVGALQILSGFDSELQNQELGEREKWEPLVLMAKLLKERIKGAEEDEDYNPSVISEKSVYKKAHKTVMVLLRLLRRPTSVLHMEKKVKMVVDELSILHQSQEQETGLHELPLCWSALPALFSRLEEDIEVSGKTNNEDANLSLKDSLKEKFTWDCAATVPDRPSMGGASSKRKSGSVADGTGKKHRTDGSSSIEVGSSGMGGLMARAGAATSSSIAPVSRRDNFRQRKPNTSRPPSMHVDDYVARERGNETVSSGNAVNQRSGSGGGRPPSIHVDEFMARQRERQLVVGAIVSADAQSLTQPPQQPSKHPSPSSKSECATNNMNMRASRPMFTDEDELQDVNIEIDGVPDADDLLSLPGADELVVIGREEGSPLAATSKGEGQDTPSSTTGRLRETKTSEASTSATIVQELLIKNDASKEVMPENVESQTKSTWQQTIQVKHSSTEVKERKQQSSDGMRVSHSAPVTSQSLDPQGTGASFVRVHELPSSSLGVPVQSSMGEQRPMMPTVIVSSSLGSRGHLHFATGPPLPPSLPPPPPIPAGVIPQKFESFVSPGMDNRLVPSSGMLISSFESPASSSMGIAPGREKRPPLPPDYLRGASENSAAAPTPPPLPPPLLPLQSWPTLETPIHRLDPGHRLPASSVTFGTVPSGHPPRPPLEAAAVTQVSRTLMSPWAATSRLAEESGPSGTGRPAPPLPPTPPPFSTAQASHLQVSPPNPNSVPPPSSLYAQSIGSLPLENRPAYVLSSGIDVSLNEKRFGSFTSSIQGQPSIPQSLPLTSPFIPPLPPGRPQSLLASTPPLQQQQPMHHPQVLAPPPPPGPPPPPPPPVQQPEQSTSVLQLQQPHFQPQIQQPLQQPSHQHSQPAQQVQQQESGKLLQQILASPDAIHDLLKDQNKLQRLLEQHPKLISLLQEKMGQG